MYTLVLLRQQSDVAWNLSNTIELSIYYKAKYSILVNISIGSKKGVEDVGGQIPRCPSPK